MKIPQEKIDQLNEIILRSNRIVFFGGAGTSTESNIPDFRSKRNGLYNQWNEKGLSPEILLSRSFFRKKPEVFFQYYRQNLIHPDALPNETHYGLAKLEKAGKLKAIITQNIDGLHQKTGSKYVLELHGSIYRNYCTECKKEYHLEKILEDNNVPNCNVCGKMVRPDVTLYEEPLDIKVIDKAINAISNADTLIIGGTSLVVYPAAGFIEFFRGSDMVIINKETTLYDQKADLVIQGSIGEVFRRMNL